MPSQHSLFSPFRKAVSAFFNQDLALRRDEAGVRIVLQDRNASPTARPPSGQQLAQQKDERLLALAIEQLAAVLDQEEGGRGRLRHLAFVEHGLKKRGWRALHKLPLEVLQKGLDQFEGLVSNWSPEGLAGLRSKMAVAVMARQQDDFEGDPEGGGVESVLDMPELLADEAIETASKSSAEEDVLLAAYAAMGGAPAAAPEVEYQGELGSPSARAAMRGASRTAPSKVEIRLRDLPT